MRSLDDFDVASGWHLNNLDLLLFLAAAAANDDEENDDQDDDTNDDTYDGSDTGGDGVGELVELRCWLVGWVINDDLEVAAIVHWELDAFVLSDSLDFATGRTAEDIVVENKVH